MLESKSKKNMKWATLQMGYWETDNEPENGRQKKNLKESENERNERKSECEAIKSILQILLKDKKNARIRPGRARQTNETQTDYHR